MIRQLLSMDRCKASHGNKMFGSTTLSKSLRQFFFCQCLDHESASPRDMSSLPLLSPLQEINDFISFKVRFRVKFNHLQNNTKKVKYFLAEILWDPNGYDTYANPVPFSSTCLVSNTGTKFSEF